MPPKKTVKKEKIKVVSLPEIEADKENDFVMFPNQLHEMKVGAADNYFLQGKMVQMNKSRRGRAKNNDLSDDELDRKEESPYTSCDLEKLKKYAAISNKFIPKSAQKVVDSIVNQFPLWKVYLVAGFNILIHGVGSKRMVLEQLAEYFENYSVCVIDGLREEGSTREVLSRIEKTFSMSITASKRKNLPQWASIIAANMRKPLYILFHNIDGPFYRDPVDQEVFKVLAQHPKIHLVATVDHINATTLWNTRQVTEFNWLFMKVDTYQIPLAEIITGQSKLLGFDKKNCQYSHSMSSLDVFWESMSKNSKEIFRALFCMTYATNQAVPFFDLSEQARSSFSVSSDGALRQILVEFKDHKIINMRRKDDGNELLEVIVEKPLIEKFFAEKGLTFEL